MAPLPAGPRCRPLSSRAVWPLSESLSRLRRCGISPRFSLSHRLKHFAAVPLIWINRGSRHRSDDLGGESRAARHPSTGGCARRSAPKRMAQPLSPASTCRRSPSVSCPGCRSGHSRPGPRQEDSSREFGRACNLPGGDTASRGIFLRGPGERNRPECSTAAGRNGWPLSSGRACRPSDRARRPAPNRGISAPVSRTQA